MAKLSTLLAILLSTTTGALASEAKVAIVFDKGGKDDKSFNTAAYQGILKAKDQLGVEIKAVESSDDNSFEPLLRSLAAKDFDLIFAVGVAQAEALKKVSAQFPQKRFAIIDAKVDAPNVRTLLFHEHEGSYLVGAIAAMTSKTGKIGFIGGMDIPLIRRFEMGYEAGAKKINPKVQMQSNYIGVTGDAWHNPPKAKEIAMSLYASGVDVIFAAAGASNTGLFDAAEEKKKFAIGVDSNQNWIKPGFVLTSMLKRVDVAVYETVQDFLKSKKESKPFDAGIRQFGLKNQGIDYSVDQYNAKVIDAATKKKADELKAQIIAGKISVPDYYQKNKITP